MAERGWFGGCSPGLDFHPGALSVSFLTLSKSSSVGLEPRDFQPEDGEQSLALGVFKIKKGPRAFWGPDPSPPSWPNWSLCSGDDAE